MYNHKKTNLPDELIELIFSYQHPSSKSNYSCVFNGDYYKNKENERYIKQCNKDLNYFISDWNVYYKYIINESGSQTIDELYSYLNSVYGINTYYDMVSVDYDNIDYMLSGVNESKNIYFLELNQIISSMKLLIENIFEYYYDEYDYYHKMKEEERKSNKFKEIFYKTKYRNSYALIDYNFFRSF